MIFKHKRSSRLAGISFIYLAILLSSLDCINTANIIAFLPIELKSSVIFSEAIVKTLAAAGHDVTYITSVPLNEHVANTTVISFHYDPLKHVVSYPNNLINAGWYTYAKYGLLSQREKFCFSDGTKRAMDDLKTLGKKYDLLIIPLTFYPKCFYPIAKEFDLPIIGANVLRSSYFSDELVGNPRNLASIPADCSSFFFYAEIFWSRFWNLFEHLRLRSIVSDYNRALYDWRFRRHFPNFDVNKLPKLSIMFSNNHHSILARPLTPNTIDVGGLHISEAKTLPRNIKTFLDEAEHGVILFSLGSVAQNSVFNSKIVQICLNVFAKLPERVIWKFSEDLPNAPQNVFVSKWLPQRDILAHKNIRAFITHCGFFGIQEAIYEGKPLIMLLLNAADQAGNAGLMYQKGVGEYLELQSMTEEKLFNAIRMVLDDKQYQEKMRHLSIVYKDRPMTPQKALVYWTEYVIRHKGAEHMQTEAVDMPFYQYFLLDILLFVLIMCVVLLWIGYFVAKQISLHIVKILRQLWKSNSKKLN